MTTDPNLVRNISCFRDLSKDQIKNIAQIANAVCYPPNQVLFKEGEPGQNLYFLRSSNLIHIQLRCAPRLRLRF
jgi:CRP-like cAMP-binding protein